MAESKDHNLYDVKKARRKGRERLSTDLQMSVNNPEDSDVVFKCNDGRLVHGCRWLLARRCPVFKSLLRNGMLETKLSEIPLEFPSTALLSIMDYCYSGTIDTYPPVDWKMGFELISAAQFFMIPTVEAIAGNFLQLLVSKIEETAQKSVLMEMLSIAVDFKETWEGKDALLLQLVYHIGENWYEMDCSHSLSRSAVGYILANSGAEGDQEGQKFDVEEYFNFRKLILWHVYQAVPAINLKARGAVQKALPGKGFFTLGQKILLSQPEIDAFISDLETSICTKSRSSTDVLNALVRSESCRNTLEYLLGYINVSRIPFSLLVRFVHPIGLISPGPLLKSLVHRAVQERVQYSLTRSDWRHGASLRTGSGGQIVCETKLQQKEAVDGMAMAFIRATTSSDVYEWSFTVLEDDTVYIDVGFVGQGAREAVTETRVMDGPLERIPEARFLRVYKNNIATHVFRAKPEVLDSKVEKNSAVNFKFSRSKRTCEVHLNKTFKTHEDNLPSGKVELNHSYKAVWDDLPGGNHFPAVSFTNCKSAKVLLRLISGFDYF